MTSAIKPLNLKSVIDKLKSKKGGNVRILDSAETSAQADEVKSAKDSKIEEELKVLT